MDPEENEALKHEVDRLLTIGRISLMFGRVNRATFHEDGVTPESDTDHTVMLGLVACHLASLLQADHLNVGTIAEYALVHDLVEAYVGDTDTTFGLDEDEREAKEAKEKRALERIESELGSQWLTTRIHEYEEQKVPEARWVRYVDKIVPKITHALNGHAGRKGRGDTLEEIKEANNRQRARLAEEYPELVNLDRIFELVAERSRSTW